MKNARKTMAGLGVAALSLSACATVDDPGGGEGGGAAAGQESAVSGGAENCEYDIALVSKGFQHQFWQAVLEGAEDKAEELGACITFEGPASESEVEEQLQMLSSAIERSPDAIGYAALDPEACVPLLDEADAVKIPVVQFDNGCDSDVPLNISRTDNAAAGALAADHMAELIGEDGEVGIVGHSQIDSTGVERRDGFVDQVEEEYPDIEIVDIQYGDGDHLESADIAKTMLSANSDLEGLYGTNEGSAIGIVNAANELGLTGEDITIIGFDSGQAQIEAIRDGIMAGAITQDPMGIGASTVESAVDAVEGEDIEEEIDTGSYWYDAENLDDPEIQDKIYR